MSFTRLFKTSFSLFLIAVLLYSGNLFANNGNKIRVLLSVAKQNYQKVEDVVNSLGGEIHIKHRYCEGMAVTVPKENLAALSSIQEIKQVLKDLNIQKPEPVQIEKPGYGLIKHKVDLAASHSQTLSGDDLMDILVDNPQNYYPYTNELMAVNDFIANTGHIGENVIVAIIDDGVSSAATAISSRILGGENFTDDGIPANSPLNDSHGTWVACCVGANAIFGFSDSAIQDAVELYAPGSTIPDYFGSGIDGIPMIGAAPGASFYALKVFEAGGGGAPRSVVAAALERAIELKTKYNSGDPDGLNIQVVNMSLGGSSLYAGNDPFYAPLTEAATDAGILVVISAGNEGPSGMSIGTPGDSRNIITVGATTDAAHERIVADLFYVGPGGGFLWRPVDNNIVTDFSSRGPTADGRRDPEIVAPGDWRFCQNVNGTTINWVGGTSFSSPTVAGTAALLLSAVPTATPNQLRAALLKGANPDALDDNSDRQDRGFGFVDAYAAYQKLLDGAFNPLDIGIETPFVKANILVGSFIPVIHRRNFSSNTGDLLPGQRKEYFYNINSYAKSVTVNISNVTPELPPEEQNQLFGDDLIVAIHSAKTSATDDYRALTPAFVGEGGATFILEGSDLDEGIARITLVGDWTNVGKVSASVGINTEYEINCFPRVSGKVTEGEIKTYEVEVPANTAELNLKLSWRDNWKRYPTDDLDMSVYDPADNLILVDNDGDDDTDGISLDSPERLSIASPEEGTYTVLVEGYTVWKGKEKFKLFTDLVAEALPPSAALGIADVAEVTSLPLEFNLTQNYPNPFNPSTVINYDLPEASFVTLKIYNIQGQLVRVLVDELATAGSHSIVFDGRNDGGSRLTSGMYVYQLVAGDKIQTKKMMILK
ncbi:MAG: S8 family serine peptidase [Ignavibacteria bacterium]|jgi:subtilisin family serine protease